jgi:hypothetical protein
MRRLILTVRIAVGGLAAAALADRTMAQEALDLSAAPTPASVSEQVPKALAQRIVTIVEKPAPSPVGDPHEYVSYGRYWWPDPAKPSGLPFIQRDGHSNEAQVNQGDPVRLDHMAETVTVLSLGWSELHREDCARRAAAWLRAWFVTPATRMKPDLDYAQVHLGHTQNRGNAAGVLDGRVLSSVVEDLVRLQGSPALDPADSAAVQAWFNAYLQWLQTSSSGRGEHAALNNHGSWYLFQAVAIAEYLGQTDLARHLCEEDRARIANQIKPDGSQPFELVRADGLWYSFFNLQAQYKIVRLAAPLGIDLGRYEAPNGASLAKALAYLRPYNADPKKWPGKELRVLPAGFLDGLISQNATP